ncbi:hypothetical protein D3C78_914700 [compost metagenome]
MRWKSWASRWVISLRVLRARMEKRPGVATSSAKIRPHSCCMGTMLMSSASCRKRVSQSLSISPPAAVSSQ